MKYVAAYLLATVGGNATPAAADIEKILVSVGIEVDAARVASLIAELDGKDINEVLAAGAAKMSAMPAGGAAPSGAVAAAGGAAAAAPAEATKEKEEEKEESDDDMGFGLFD
ncbi:60S acidic ribosomal protein P2 [Podochytrium sp. JEL0797]|nr:60S acidic ribosomal protein P2 [Podochytrium sp. JEL0797]